jgi:hypothetical protein
VFAEKCGAKHPGEFAIGGMMNIGPHILNAIGWLVMHVREAVRAAMKSGK